MELNWQENGAALVRSRGADRLSQAAAWPAEADVKGVTSHAESQRPVDFYCVPK